MYSMMLCGLLRRCSRYLKGDAIIAKTQSPKLVGQAPILSLDPLSSSRQHRIAEHVEV